MHPFVGKRLTFKEILEQYSKEEQDAFSSWLNGIYWKAYPEGTGLKWDLKNVRALLKLVDKKVGKQPQARKQTLEEPAPDTATDGGRDLDTEGDQHDVVVRDPKKVIELDSDDDPEVEDVDQTEKDDQSKVAETELQSRPK